MNARKDIEDIDKCFMKTMSQQKPKISAFYKSRTMRNTFTAYLGLALNLWG